MKDIKLNEELEFVDGDFALVSDTECVKQQVIVALRTDLNDWFLDYTKGVPYFDLMKAGNDTVLKAKIKKAIKEVYGVDQITKFNYNRIRENITVMAGVIINNEEYTITEAL